MEAYPSIWFQNGTKFFLAREFDRRIKNIHDEYIKYKTVSLSYLHFFAGLVVVSDLSFGETGPAIRVAGAAWAAHLNRGGLLWPKNC
ncbi:MAG TPA: hypothetical protein VND94_23750 [Terriglobia bacterium]|nr:hypothetical protein [Terriglobia bacterium]